MGAIHQEIAGLEPGTHACFPYVSPEEHRTIVAAFLREGLRRGERCLYVAGEPAREAVSEQLAELGTPVAEARAQRALVMMDAEQVYPRGPDFDPDQQARLLESLIDSARAEGFSGFRGVGEAPNAHERFAREPLMRYEAAASDVLRNKRAMGLCVYDRLRTDPDTLVGILRSHPQAILGGRVCGNPFCDPPAYLLGRVGEDRKLDWMINQILASEQSRQFDRAVNEALLREATSLAAQSHRLRDRLDDVRRAVDARDLLCGMLARRLRGGVARIASRLETLHGNDRLEGPARSEIEAGREDIEALLSLAAQIESVAAFNEMHVDLQPERLDLAATTRAAVAAFQDNDVRPPVEVNLHSGEAVWGRWDRRRLGEAVAGLVTVACEHGWSSPLEARIEALGETARLTMRFHCVDVDPKAGAPGLAGGRAPCSAYDRLGIELWTSRELVRVMGGTFGVSSYADGRVIFTVDLPRGETT